MPNKYADRPYKVGKGKPPVHTQFGKDRPGNRNGRPPGSSNINTALKKALAVRITVTENGKERRITKGQALATQLANKAASGELKAIEIVMRLMRDVETPVQPEVPAKPLNALDRAVLERFANLLKGDGKDGT